VVDDVWCSVGSDNFNRRSWTHDSELSNAILDDTRDERAPLDPAGLGDGARRFPRDLRLALMHEHLDLPPVANPASPSSSAPSNRADPHNPSQSHGGQPDHIQADQDRADSDLVDPDTAVRAFRAAADALRDWHANGEVGPRPPGRLVPHDTKRLPWHQRIWALPAYRLIYDPDGRPWRARRAGDW
jgi:phosphatidylserine/phosphatidylglycerophosphate/cardiolipin synthase-like enzyme